jgi:hypothetical protein
MTQRTRNMIYGHKTAGRKKTLFINGLLLMGLIGLLIAYLAVVASNVPAHVYTSEQYEYLSYNRGRIINQDAPIWNVILPDEQVVPAALSDWKTHVQAVLDARYEEQGGVVVTVYDLDFHGEFHLVYPGPTATTVELFFPFPGNLETLHDVRFLVDGTEPPEARYSLDGISWQTEIEADEEHYITIGYKADGASSFTYALNHGRRSKVLDVEVTVLGLGGSQVTKASLPTTNTSQGVAEGSGETFTWDYTNLIPSRDIQVDLPTRLGFAQRVERLQDDFRVLASLAPFLISLFLVSLAGLLHLIGVRLPLTSYLLTGCGLALFYPMLTFLSGLVTVVLAATISLCLISGLVLLFLGLAAGWRRTAWRVALLLAIFLGFFSLGTLTPWWRLLLTGGGLLLVGTFMLHYARRLASPEPETVIPLPPAAGESAEMGDEPPPAEPEVVPEPIHRHCPHCGRALADDHTFCPGCGHNMHAFCRCAGCGHEQFVPSGVEPAHCTRCGRRLT